INLPFQVLWNLHPLGIHRRNISMINILAELLPEISLIPQFGSQQMPPDGQHAVVDQLKMADPLLGHQYISDRMIVQVRIYPTGFKRMGIGKKTAFTKRIAQVKNGMELIF